MRHAGCRPALTVMPTLFRSATPVSRASLADPKRLGPDDTTWTWGRMWVSRFPHPLAGRAVYRRPVCDARRAAERQRADAECRFIRFDAAYREPRQLGRDAGTLSRSAKAATRSPRFLRTSSMPGEPAAPMSFRLQRRRSKRRPRSRHRASTEKLDRPFSPIQKIRKYDRGGFAVDVRVVSFGRHAAFPQACRGFVAGRAFVLQHNRNIERQRKITSHSSRFVRHFAFGAIRVIRQTNTNASASNSDRMSLTAKSSFFQLDRSDDTDGRASHLQLVAKPQRRSHFVPGSSATMRPAVGTSETSANSAGLIVSFSCT